MKKISVKKHDQRYLYQIIQTYPKISSGRKNYSEQYYRVLKNILLAQVYDLNCKKNINYLRNVSFKKTNNFLSILLK